MTAADRHCMSVMLTSKDMKKSMHFYCEQLGFEMKEAWPDRDNPMWANMVLGGQSVMIGSAMDPDTVGQMCGDDEVAKEYFTQAAKDFQNHPAGVGISIYLQVDDIDSYVADVRAKGLEVKGEPKNQFYGIRDIGVNDPDGYRLTLFSPITMTECQSCGMPLANADPGQMYCQHCLDEQGQLRPYEHILEGTITGYFMGMQKMSRGDAEVAAKEHLAKMPAWGGSC